MPAPGKQSRGGWRGRPARGGPRWLFHPVRHPSHTSAITHPAQRCPPPLPPSSPLQACSEVPLRWRRAASTTQPASQRLQTPPCIGPLSLSLSPYCLSTSIGSISLVPLLLRLRVREEEEEEKRQKKDEIIPLLLPHRRRRRRRGRATPRITSPASSLVLPLCGLLRALARTATGHCDYAA